MPFLVTYTAWNALFREKERKKDIAKLERKERKKKNKNN
jgi:hypothetical protein